MAVGFNKHFGGRRGGKRNVPFYSGCVADLKKKITSLQTENTRLREVLVKYGKHHPLCGYKADDSECWCGFIQMQKEIKALTPKP